jgi:hypothetical protein
MGHAMVGLDFIGDVHGHLPALERLGQVLGYDIHQGWRHPDGRIPVFLGDLVDRGPYSLETARLVADLVADRRAFCLMGNHEYNLAAWEAELPGWEQPKHSNRATCADVRARAGEWSPVLEFIRKLPIALELPDLRAIHASWHGPAMARLTEVLGTGRQRDDAMGVLEDAVVVGSPFDGRGMRAGLVASGRGAPDEAHEVLLKGHEAAADAPFLDADGRLREEIRVLWWQNGDPTVPRDRPLVIGHYWNLPPASENDGEPPHWAPPWPSGHPELRAWWQRHAPKVALEGRRTWTGDHLCVDFNGLTRALGDRACVGAMRWPEREVVWATAPVAGPIVTR